jgi:hypothetical protein
MKNIVEICGIHTLASHLRPQPNNKRSVHKFAANVLHSTGFPFHYAWFITNTARLPVRRTKYNADTARSPKVPYSVRVVLPSRSSWLRLKKLKPSLRYTDYSPIFISLCRSYGGTRQVWRPVASTCNSACQTDPLVSQPIRNPITTPSTNQNSVYCQTDSPEHPVPQAELDPPCSAPSLPTTPQPGAASSTTLGPVLMPL